jgi:hypothetical protein
MQPSQQAYETYADCMLARILSDMAPDQTPPAALHAYFTALYRDMQANPCIYALPDIPYVPFLESGVHLPEEVEPIETGKAARLKIRKAVFAYVEFLFQLGQMGLPEGEDLLIPRAELDKLLSEGAKTARSKAFTAAMQRCGLAFSADDPVKVNNTLYPGMAAQLAPFSAACAKTEKHLPMYFFRRCDLAVLNGKGAPVMEDVLHIVPQEYRSDVAETDARLMRMRYKREIFPAGLGAYNLRFSHKGNQVVYWVRIFEPNYPDLHHVLRWKLDSPLTTALFASLDETAPGLADQVFDGLKTCAYCYGESCMSRSAVERGGVSKTVCGEGWNHIGHDHADDERLWTVIETLQALV